MDIDISGWILEFLLRQKSIDDRLLNVLIRGLPLPDNNPSLKKSLILRKIESDIEKGAISERTLEFLEQIEELDSREGNGEVSEAMKAAYCAVAVHCTAKFIDESADDKEGKYFSAVKRIWRGRVGEMEKFDVGKKIGLVSEDLLIWRDDLEAGIWDVSVCENVLARYKGLDVLQVMQAYVNEVKEKMGPSFLESVAETLNDEEIRGIMGLGKAGESDDQIKKHAATVVPDSDKGLDANATSKDKEPYKANVPPRRKHLAMRRPRGAGSRTHGAKIVDTEELSPNTYDSIPTPEVHKVQEALETSASELHAVVKDPLPDALRLAKSFKPSVGGENMVHDCVVDINNPVDVGAPGPSLDRNGDTLETNVDDLDVGCSRDQNKGPKTSLMERNSTAHTMEWSDSIDNSSEIGSPTRPHLPSPKRRAVSPLKKYEIKNLSRTRKKKRWTTIEEDTLRTGVQRYGKGNWKLILNVYRDIFEDRTEVDLKDKWRNLIR